MAFPSELFKDAVLYDVQDGIAIITMNQQKTMNTFSGELSVGVTVALDMASEDPNVRVVVLTGSGKAFSAGGSLSGGEGKSASDGFRAPKGSKIPATVNAAIRNLRMGMKSSEVLKFMDKPTIAAVNGACAGAGFSWACACDLRFAADSAIFRTAFASAGLSGDYGGTWTLPRIVGPAKARELYLLNKKIRAEEAKSIGLVADVFPDSDFLGRVLQEARIMSEAPPLALKRIKQNLNDADRLLSFSEALDLEAERHARSGFHPDAAEAGKAFVEKRAGNFTGSGKREPWEMSKL